MKRCRLTVALLSGLFVTHVSTSIVQAAASPPVAVSQGQDDEQQDITVQAAQLVLDPDKAPPALYFTISNHGSAVHLLSDVSTPGCASLVGQHVDQENTPETQDLFKHLALPAATTLVFAPGGYSLACFGQRPDIQVGRSIPVTFRFYGGATKVVQAEVITAQDNKAH